LDVEAARALAPWISALASGLAFAGLALAVYLTFRVLDFPDLTVDGSLGFGASVTAALITFGHWNPWLTLLAAAGAGALAGLATGLLHTVLKVNGLLASILVSISMFTINLRVMNGSTAPLFGVDTIYTGANGDPGALGQWLAPFGALAARGDFRASVVLLVMMSVIVALCYWWLQSEQGLALRATGDNPRMIRALGVNTGRMKILGLAVANGLCGLSGAVLAQQLGFADITLGPGSILTGLAAVILGEALLHGGGVLAGLLGAVLGSVVFQFILALTQVQLTLEPTDYKLASALIVLIALVVPAIRGRLRLRSLRAPREAAGQERPA
jgi:putative tryptophan/tyrosine transport system permease protein